jgi:hypothetical protein
LKQSWIVGIVMIYVVLQGWTMVLQNSSTGDSQVWSSLNNVWYMNLTQLVGSTVSAIWAPALTVIAVFMSFISIIALYYPAIFTGTFIWFWWVVCLPIAVSFIISIITIIRGVHSS